MLGAIHEREGRWDQVDPDTEVGSIGEGIGLSEDQSYELFKLLVDEHYVHPGRILQAGGAMPGSSWTKASSTRVVLIGPVARCRAAPAGSSGAKTT